MKRITVLLSMIMILFMKTPINGNINEQKPCIVETTETVYVICDVDEVEVGANNETIMAVIMQDGSIHDYTVTDAPEGYISEVCFKANDIDDFTSYEVVALR